MVDASESAEGNVPADGRTVPGRLRTAMMRLRVILGICAVAVGVAVFLTMYAKTRRTRFPLDTVSVETAPLPATSPATRRAAPRTIEERFGTEHVANLVMRPNSRLRNVRPTIEPKLADMVVSSQRVVEWSGVGNRISWKLAPVDDLAELAKRVDFGTVVINQNTRTLTVTLDPAKFRAP
jgi:hypothetical protein